jgi:hypothetical protein
MVAADQDPAIFPRFVGIGEIHILLHQERPQVFVDLLQRGVFDSCRRIFGIRESPRRSIFAALSPSVPIAHPSPALIPEKII